MMHLTTLTVRREKNEDYVRYNVIMHTSMYIVCVCAFKVYKIKRSPSATTLTLDLTISGIPVFRRSSLE